MVSCDGGTPVRKKAFCLVLSKWYVKFVAYERKDRKGKTCLLEKEAIREKTDLECKEKIATPCACYVLSRP